MFDSNLLTNVPSDIEFTFEELTTISQALANAIEYAKDAMSTNISLQDRIEIQQDITDYSALLLKVNNYLDEYGIDVFATPVR